MREIKFRGICDNQWVYGLLSHVKEEFYECEQQIPIGFKRINPGYYISGDNGKPLRYKIENPGTIGQYTGLQDSYGEDVYEGDQVKVFDYSGHVFANVTVDFASFGGWGFDSIWKYSNYGLEIIGNIHKKPIPWAYK